MGITTDVDNDARAAQDDGRTTTELETAESPSLRVIETIAAVTDADPLTMPPLYDTVDPDALDTVLDADGTIEIVFEYDGHAVEVTGDGEVRVDGRVAQVGDAQ